MLDPASVGEGAAQAHAEGAREGGLHGTGVGARMAAGVGAPRPYGAARIGTGRGGEDGGQPGPRPAGHVVQARGRPAEAAVPGGLVTHHGVQGVDGPEAQQSRHPGSRAPHQGAHDRVGGVLGDRLDHGPRDPVGVQRLRVPAAQMRQPGAGRLDVPGRQGGPDGLGLAGEGGAADDGPGGRGGQGDGGGGGGAYDTCGQRAERDGATGAHGGVQSAPAAVVVPQRALNSGGRAPERGDRMPAAGIAEEEVAEKSGGGAVRVTAIGGHRLSRPWSPRQWSWYWSFGSRAWRCVLTQGVRALVRRDPAARVPGYPGVLPR
ncbi:hypothetical protein GPN2_12399 [Streptomyces murinus]